MAEIASGPFCHICSCALYNPPDSTGICMCDPTTACPMGPVGTPRLRASTEAMLSPTRSSSIKEPIVDATAKTQLVGVLLPTASFTQEYVNAAFGFEVKEIKFQKLTKLHRLWHYILDNGIAAFGYDGPVNIWGFHSVHVLDRQGWNACMLALGFNIARGRGGMPAQRPKQAIYEIIKYCGMKAVRSQGTQQPRVDKKALEQDDYMFDSAIFHCNKHRAGGW